ncbi:MULTISPECIES: type II toxin-antitoxin system HigA family antitoxin [unclassified Oceanispirochaeta]|uniref:helix-turn-helix domain-containing protein n=1 Tax=unclassified Oceanispirochaeta TaxID=2635722 RepID=UPI000E08E9F6|nr:MULTISPECIES: helix-turn-helix domain-containing protein [unclassified Oceanispirochaeta]MBF9015832.1 helix-turn-helix domain-containing protein [Oceanispirochaeta sp. M2]NPD72295.1 helix-turn-helix domain-containing protein [Oceanispirochaeta sp. M1]RDG32069.1 helix-turn-helix domain-containing protein [Oceanispirochaeta sp. M1]
MIAVQEKVQFSKEIAKFEIKNEEQAIQTEELLEEVLEAVAEGNEDLRAFMGFLEYELEKYKTTLIEKKATGAEVLIFLMKQHGHVQKDLSYLISRSTISELLNGKREFTTEHMKKLGEFYRVSPAVFMCNSQGN